MHDLLSIFQYSFFINAIAAGFLTSILAGIAGTYIVSRKIVFISGGITHASFGGIGMAFFLGLNPFLGAAVFAVLSALGIEWATSKANVREDSAIAILWSLGMAIGIIFVFLTPGYAPNLMSFLFGNILTVTHADLSYMLVLAIIVSICITLFYRPVLYTAFDPEFAQTTGLKTQLIKYAVTVVVALTIVFSIRIAGIILVLSLFTIPQSIAGIFTHDFKAMIFYSIGFGFVGIMVGLVGSYYYNLPSGAIIIFTLVLIWALIKGFSKIISPLLFSEKGEAL
ncbi:zinc transport system permease protein [Saccharicrinis carchari]|uniref:Zinc transport system permease protein n=1 Tax=Saccharicrinis carchari TaxID=1168039 RepID=A0A521CLX4_SACCC|nr:metal ABC transporter permease [Saccharicrinis carchari]SMO60438.1 zinc transport system permease protein [Saccharicrinis carchari]